jgi:hypothetical protein
MNSHELLLAAKARMGKKLRTFRVGSNWFTLKKSNTTYTGCNIYFDDYGHAWREGLTTPFRIYEKGVDIDDMSSIMDAIIMWFLYPDQALKIVEADT